MGQVWPRLVKRALQTFVFVRELADVFSRSDIAPTFVTSALGS